VRARERVVIGRDDAQRAVVQMIEQGVLIGGRPQRRCHDREAVLFLVGRFVERRVLGAGLPANFAAVVLIAPEDVGGLFTGCVDAVVFRTLFLGHADGALG